MKNMNKKGEVAMGTLIIFIAMILIAAVAAAVLISSIGSIQSKALETGKATTQEIGTNINTVEIYGFKENDSASMENFSMVVRLAAGSEPIRFEDLLLTVGTKDLTNEFIYVEGTTFSEGKFIVDYLLNGTNNQAGYIVKGDVVKLDFALTSAISEDEAMRFTLIPKIGTPSVVFATTPTTIANARETVFP